MTRPVARPGRAAALCMTMLAMAGAGCGDSGSSENAERDRIAQARQAGQRQAERERRLRERQDARRQAAKTTGASAPDEPAEPGSADPGASSDAPPAAAAELSAAGFHTGTDTGETVPAAICQRSAGKLVCWTPNDGFTLVLDVTGAAYRDRGVEAANRGRLAAGRPALAFGDRWRRGSFTCQSSRAGLTCRNGAGRGFTLPRYRGMPAYL